MIATGSRKIVVNADLGIETRVPNEDDEDYHGPHPGYGHWIDGKSGYVHTFERHDSDDADPTEVSHDSEAGSVASRDVYSAMKKGHIRASTGDGNLELMGKGSSLKRHRAAISGTISRVLKEGGGAYVDVLHEKMRGPNDYEGHTIQTHADHAEFWNKLEGK